MVSEGTLSGWTGPSSDTEQDKQERTERMVRQAIDAHAALTDCSLHVYTKGSYVNKTNVRSDSDVDIAVQCQDVVYWEEQSVGAHPVSSAYTGIWTPSKLRSELVAALEAKFPGQVDTTGSTAIRVNSSSARVEADVVPCFNFRYYFNSGGTREGARTFKKSGGSFENYPVQHLANGRKKNTDTSLSFKRAVRILKRVENAMVTGDVHREVPSYFVECLVYNCPNSILNRSTWTNTVKGILGHIWSELEGDEPEESRWMEVNGVKYLFHSCQKWTRQDGRDFAYAAWNYLGFAS
jgi:hypothetical protein